MAYLLRCTRQPSGCPDNTRDGAHDALELGDFDVELFLAACAKGVVARATVAGSHSPLGDDPAFDEHALKSWVERAFFDLEDLLGVVLDRFSNFVAVEFATHSQGLEDQEVESSRWDFVARHGFRLPPESSIVRLCQCEPPEMLLSRTALEAMAIRNSSGR
jgi:hypothetical protein